MKRWAGLFVVAIVTALAALYFLNQSKPHEQLDAAAVAKASPAAPNSTAALATASAQPGLPPPTAAVTATASNSPMFFESVQIDTSASPPRACLQFSEPVPGTMAVHYGDYLKITPPAQVSYQAAGRQVCLLGLGYGDNYSVSIASGLPASNGDKTASEQIASITFGDTPPSVDFADSGFILPREDAEGLGVATINVDKVKISIARISDRALALSEMLGLQAGTTGHSVYGDGQAQSVAVPVWHGEMDIANVKNKRVLTAIPLAKVVDRSKPGAYRVSVTDDAFQNDNSDSDDDGQPSKHHRHYHFSHFYQDSESDLTQHADRWILNTDLALTTMAGTDGLHVFVRSLQTGKADAGVKLSLISGGNEELGTAETDGDGHAVFAPGLMRGAGAAGAHAVMAYKGDDFTFMELNRPGFDLSDRGVEGRQQPGAIDAYLYADRGIYRPGETIQLSALIRGNTGNALDAQPVNLSLKRPDGVEVFSGRATPNEAGLLTQAIPISTTAPRGTWTVAATSAGDKKVIGSATVEVQDFVPQRLKVKLSSDAKAAGPGQAVVVHVDGRYLYGAPAAGLLAEGEAKLMVDPAPFPALKEFSFGGVDDKFETQTIPIDSVPADGEGKANLSIPTPADVATSVPLKLQIIAGMTEPGGRVTNDEISLPLSSSALLIGIKPSFDSGYVAEGQQAAFQVIARNPDGSSPVHVQLHYRVVKEQENFGYYMLNGSWRWRDLEHDEPQAEGTIDVSGDAPALLQTKADWGSYRVELDDPASKARSSVRFHGGWFSQSTESDSPEKAQVILAGDPPKPGEDAKIVIKPPFAGEMVMTVASDRVFSTRTMSVPAEGATIDVPASADWGSGAYVIASIYRPQAQAKGHEPLRAIGLVWVPLNQAAHTISVAMTVPEKARPRGRLELPVSVTGVPSGETAYLTVSAVDEGILQLTKFASPDANDYFFGKRQLSETIRDDYAHLIDGNAAKAGELRQGGDSLGGVGLSVVPTRTVALFSGPVTIGADGKANVAFDIPDFNGELRLMAVASSKTALGHADAPLTVRDPVVGEVSLSRFLAPGDKGTLTLQVNNVEGPAGSYTARLSASGPVKLDGAAETTRTYDLAAGAQKIDTLPIQATDIGIATVALTLTGPNDYHVDRSWQIQSRGAAYPLTLAEKGSQAAGDTYRVPQSADFLPGSATTQVSYSRLPGLDLPGMLDTLELYPYGCSEQLTSIAFPLVYYDRLMKASGQPTDQNAHNRVQDTIGKLLDRQGTDGTFGLWREYDGFAGPWLNVYIVDFLQRAKQEGYQVPQEALDRSYAMLGTIAHRETGMFGQVSYWSYNQFWRELETNRAAAYAFLVLANAKQVEIGDVRYFNDTFTTLDGVAKGNLGAALAILGDEARAKNDFDVAEAWAAASPTKVTYLFWETRLTQQANLVSLAAEAGDVGRSRRLAAALELNDLRPDRMNTQELAWTSIAAASLITDSRPIALRIAGHDAPAPAASVTLKPNQADMEAGYSITNTMGDALFRSVVYRGIPKVAPPAIQQGFTLTRTVTHMDGTPINLSQLHQNDRMIVRIEGNATDAAYHQSVIVDMLPAGFEIESVLRPTQGSYVDGYDWLGPVSAMKVGEARDDRFVAAVDLEDNPSDDLPIHRRHHHHHPVPDEENADDNDNTPVEMGEAFNVAYVVRAVTPGQFTLPATVVEDLYKPEQMARLGSGTVAIAPPQ